MQSQKLHEMEKRHDELNKAKSDFLSVKKMYIRTYRRSSIKNKENSQILEQRERLLVDCLRGKSRFRECTHCSQSPYFDRSYVPRFEKHKGENK